MQHPVSAASYLSAIGSNEIDDDVAIDQRNSTLEPSSIYLPQTPNFSNASASGSGVSSSWGGGGGGGGGGRGYSSYGAYMADTLWIYGGPCIFVIGIIGNILILLVTSQRRMRGTSTCVYLQWMAAADLTVLLSGIIPEWLEAREIIVIKEQHPALCKLEKFAFYTSSDTSIWICVLFTLDRFVAVCFPFERRGSWCCRKASHAKYLAVGAFLLAAAKNMHVFWTRGPQYVTRNNVTLLLTGCGRPTLAYARFETFVRPWIAVALVNALPFCVIVFCNIFIVRALIRMRRARHLVAVIVMAPTDNSVFQMTALCLSASFCFLVCITPSMIMLIGKPYWNSPPSDAYAIVKSITNQIFYVNHSINFFLYCVTGNRFRVALHSTLFCRPDDPRSSTKNNSRNIRRPAIVASTAVTCRPISLDEKLINGRSRLSCTQLAELSRSSMGDLGAPRCGASGSVPLLVSYKRYPSKDGDLVLELNQRIAAAAAAAAVAGVNGGSNGHVLGETERTARGVCSRAVIGGRYGATTRHQRQSSV